MMDISCKKGYIFALVMFLIILAVITSIGIYAYSGHVAREVRIEKKVSIRDYYYSVAGARYAQILLKDPVANFGFSTEGFNGETRQLTLNKTSSLGADLCFSGNDTLTIKATEYNDPTSTPWEVNSYQVEASFTR